jgi:hypothetical protein
MSASCFRHGAAALSYGKCRSLRWLALLSVIAIVPMAAPAIAQDTYPNRPVKIIAPQAPGGGVDLVARIIADKLRLALGQPSWSRTRPERAARSRRRWLRARSRTATR